MLAAFSEGMEAVAQGPYIFPSERLQPLQTLFLLATWAINTASSY